MAAGRRVVWTRPAQRELVRNVEYVARQSQAAAERLLRDILARSAQLEALPERGRRVPDLTSEVLREVYVHRYRIIYRVTANEVVIVTLLHTSRDITTALDGEQT